MTAWTIRAAFDVPETTPLRALRSILMVGLAPHLDRVRYRRVAWREPWADVPLPDWLDADWLARTGLAARGRSRRNGWCGSAGSSRAA